MRGSSKVRIALAAVATAAVAMTALPASAETGVMTISGSGTISPALTLAGGQQTWTLSSSGVVATTATQGIVNRSWTGTDSGTIAAGSGSFTGTCSTPVGSASIIGNYSRSGTVWTINGTASGGGITGGFGAGCKMVI